MAFGGFAALATMDRINKRHVQEAKEQQAMQQIYIALMREARADIAQKNQQAYREAMMKFKVAEEMRKEQLFPLTLQMKQAQAGLTEGRLAKMLSKGGGSGGGGRGHGGGGGSADYQGGALSSDNQAKQIEDMVGLGLPKEDAQFVPGYQRTMKIGEATPTDQTEMAAVHGLTKQGNLKDKDKKALASTLASAGKIRSKYGMAPIKTTGKDKISPEEKTASAKLTLGIIKTYHRSKEDDPVAAYRNMETMANALGDKILDPDKRRIYNLLENPREIEEAEE